MNDFNHVVQFHRRDALYGSRAEDREKLRGRLVRTVLDGCHTGGLCGLAAVDIRGRSGDVRRSWVAQSESGRGDLPEQFDFPPEISPGALSPPGHAPAPAECSA